MCGAPRETVAQWNESTGEVGQNLETLKAHDSSITELGSLRSGLIGFLVKFTSDSTPQTLKFYDINI